MLWNLATAPSNGDVRRGRDLVRSHPQPRCQGISFTPPSPAMFQEIPLKFAPPQGAKRLGGAAEEGGAGGIFKGIPWKMAGEGCVKEIP